MGEVYRALDTRLEREVAVKLVSDTYLITGHGSGSPSPVTPHATPDSHVSHERFLREARSSALPGDGAVKGGDAEALPGESRW
jgi:serine/threonine protein kinase